MTKAKKVKARRYRVGTALRITKSPNTWGHCYSPGDTVEVKVIHQHGYDVQRKGDGFMQIVKSEDVRRAPCRVRT